MKLNTSPLLIDFLKHIQSELGYIIRATANLDADSLLSDETKSRAVTHSLLIVGEACKRVPDEFRFGHPEFDWRGFAGLRDRLIHHYWGIDQTLFWEAVTVDVPTNKEWIDVIIERESAKLSSE
ncbi:HepT-like ribonuclease domain-containing protein [Spirosoma panaciterrae]|uniref:HepT-like ribonuclease domain-containing protein n=1 Tax=Spirosoma panaciterrae TaxID=496058 RepID=UPI0005946AEF|nr:HepT-like ribonuclease domain-containing protein [Spirosoma panaciterrae]